MVDRYSELGLVSHPIVINNLNSFESGMKEASLRGQNKSKVVSKNSEPYFSNFIVLVIARMKKMDANLNQIALDLYK